MGEIVTEKDIRNVKRKRTLLQKNGELHRHDEL